MDPFFIWGHIRIKDYFKVPLDIEFYDVVHARETVEYYNNKADLLKRFFAYFEQSVKVIMAYLYSLI